MTLPVWQTELDDAAGAVLTVDLGALRANYLWLAAAVAPAACAAVVKADAYGLGAAAVAPVLYRAGCRDFFVAHLSEAVALRPLLPADAALMVLNGLQPGTDAACAAAGAVPVLNSLEQAESWADFGLREGRRLPAVVQLDTGMSRLGLPPDEFDALLAQPKRLAALDVVLAMSHLACSDEPGHPANAAQHRCFSRLLERLPGTRVSFANSGGILLDRSFHHDLARPGVALYGVNPTPDAAHGLRPVVRLDARVIQLRTIPAGTAVGYGAAFVAARPSRIATIAVGYADGWPRHLGGAGAAYVDGVRLPIAGRVSMDSITLDVTDLPEGRLRRGSTVELLGPHQSLDQVAAEAGTIPYEILTGLGHRYARRILDASNEGTPP
ncbi:alanine racemase [Lichenihabitans sp. Uapishka_5]|uniref:alanine racemase n=1 Tax=Lichenihabitans sp. Uapishka_5 TaxID=3037302 RepID=UPI0029E7E65E|nr:alanine racemase [Lichenihabitans sp. Uapishka_5]MDX7952855.1 alanine racemase [Lichenihabitans sp. Uapishka_5]